MEYVDEKGMISPEGRPLGIKTALTTFSRHLFDELVSRTGAKRLCTLAGAIEVELYTFTEHGSTYGVYMSPVGAPAAVCALEQVGACGVERFVAFGICGALTDVSVRSIVVPTRSLRDEGTSKSYAAPSEFIELENAEYVRTKLTSYGIDCAVGGCWTTDAFYRETRSAVDNAVARGCIAVDMESAALQAACDYRGKEFYTFFITADSLAGDKWEPNYILDPTATDAESAIVAAAVRLAEEF